jgi:drug/metabolite transporter (DMT)-like permease
MRRAEGLPDATTLVLFAAVVTLGGGNFLAVRFSNAELPPFWGAGLRFALAAGVFVAMAMARRLPLPRGGALVRTLVYGFLNFALFYALMYWALLRVTAGAAAIVLAVVPLVTLLLAAAQGLERFRWRGGLGAAIALGGIAWMTVRPGQAAIPIDALLAIVAAAACVGQSIIVAKRLSSNHPVVTNAVGMTVGAALLLAGSALVGETWALPSSAQTTWALAYLVTFGSVGLFASTLAVIRRWTVTASSYAVVLMPVATLGLEALLAGVPITGSAVLGAALVAVGVWVGALAPVRVGTVAAEPVGR